MCSWTDFVIMGQSRCVSVSIRSVFFQNAKLFLTTDNNLSTGCQSYSSSSQQTKIKSQNQTWDVDLLQSGRPEPQDFCHIWFVIGRATVRMMQWVDWTVESFLRSTLLVEVYEGSPVCASNPSQHDCYSVVSASWATMLELFYIILALPRGFIVCYEYKYRLALARCTRLWEQGRGGGMIEILVNLQEVIWTGACRIQGMVSVCFCLHSHWDLCEMRLSRHMAHTLPPFRSVESDPQLIDQAAYMIAALGVNLISLHKHKTSAPLSLTEPIDHLTEKLRSR